MYAIIFFSVYIIFLVSLTHTLLFMTKTKELQDILTKHIQSLPIAWFLIDEALSLIDSLKYYKLRNINKNLDGFMDFLSYLDSIHGDNIKEITKPGSKPCNSNEQLPESIPPLYYISQAAFDWLDEKQQQSYQCLTHQQHANVAATARSFFLLSGQEFAQWSGERLRVSSIQHQDIYHKKD